ncbi:MAG: HD domain-containing protein [Erysipelotrichaceae bacterium]|nr:HD domain-containing protein [Erysipelotrichaceae bacterium]
MITLNEDLKFILERFSSSGYEAFLVGGCVRDAIMGLQPHDYDITTNARPSQVHDLFSDCRIIDTGIKHGTVTLLLNGEPYEITTFRKETEYDDHRHPNSVSYSDSLYEDLVRRDFTINAFAYNPDKGLIDYFNGTEDLNNRVLRCVGNPGERFEEDALRILRALRFASRFHLTIEPETHAALLNKKELLRYVSVERIALEFNEILCNDNAREYLDEYREVIAVFLPEIKVMFDYDQHSRYHNYDLWHHTLKVLEEVPPQLSLRWAALLHDIGKPAVKTEGKDGRWHFINHRNVSARMTETILKRLHFDNKNLKHIVSLVRYHDNKMIKDIDIKMMLSKSDMDFFRELIILQKADNKAHYPEFVNDSSYYDELLNKAEEFSSSALHLSDLRVNGDDLIKIGITGPDVGKALGRALKMVLEEKLDNNKEDLLKYIRTLKKTD